MFPILFPSSTAWEQIGQRLAARLWPCYVGADVDQVANGRSNKEGVEMADQPKPLEAELDQARDIAALPDAEQLELIRDSLPGRDAGAAVIVDRRRGRGRPPGARNRRNAKFRDQILALGPHPALALQRAYSRPVEVLAAELGCTALEAFQLQVRAAAELLPYIEGKQPVTVDLRQHHDAVIVMAGAPGVGAAELMLAAEQAVDGMIFDLEEGDGYSIEGADDEAG